MSERLTPELNEQAKAALSQILTDLQSMRDFTIEQAPEVVQQMVAYEATMAWTWMAVSCFAMLITGIAFCVGLKLLKDPHDPVFAFAMSGMLAALPSLLSLFVFGFNLEIAIKATFFPKWFIVEKLTQLLS